MRILVISKRQYTGHDLIDDQYGRLREVPLALARRGHRVLGLCLSYANRSEDIWEDRDVSGQGDVTWHSYNAGALKIPGLIRFQRRAIATARRFSPDVIWACSDSIYAVMGMHIATVTGSCCAVDLYDNFEAFLAVRLPGVRERYRKAVRDAPAVTCVSEPLRSLIKKNYNRTGPTEVLTNAIDKKQFYPRNRESCRNQLGLPTNAKLIGTAGALHSNRGIATLFSAFEKLATRDCNIHLVVAGTRSTEVRLPLDARVHDLGVLPHSLVPALLGSLDVAVVCNKDSDFGRYCFPQKAYEILACGVPIAAANVGAMSLLLRDYPGCLFKPDSDDDLVRVLEAQLINPTVPQLPVPTWDDIGAQLEATLVRSCGAGRTPP